MGWLHLFLSLQIIPKKLSFLLVKKRYIILASSVNYFLWKFLFNVFWIHGHFSMPFCQVISQRLVALNQFQKHLCLHQPALMPKRALILAVLSLIILQAFVWCTTLCRNAQVNLGFYLYQRRCSWRNTSSIWSAM